MSFFVFCFLFVIQHTYINSFVCFSRLRDLQLKQNLTPIRNTLSKAMSGGAKAVSSGRSKLMKGVDAFWNEGSTDGK